MIRCTIREAARATGATLLSGADAPDIQDVQIDSRKVAAGSAFVCFPGERVNGNDYAERAAEAGASCVVITEDLAPERLQAIEADGTAVLRAKDDDPTEFMLRLAGFWRERNPQWIVVGVTGSVGKTTTKDMLKAALSTKYRTHATAGNFNNLIGVPLTILGASADDEAVVCEMGMNHKGELERLSACARPNAAVVTNVGTSHIGLLGSRENIARAKAEIVLGMGAYDGEQGHLDPTLFLTSDNDFAPLIEHEYAEPHGITVGHVGASEGDSPRAAGISLDDQGRARFTLSFSDGWSSEVTLGAPGRHLVNDELLALAIADLLGCDRQASAEAIRDMPQTHMRLEIVGGTDGCPRVIDDTYNASPSSTAAALDVLAELPCEGRRIAVLGEMGELGDEAPRLHGYVGAYAAAKPIDLLIFIGTTHAAEMAEAARTMGFSEDHLESFATVDDALSAFSDVFTQDDLVLAKASRAAGLDRFVKGVLA